MAIVFSGTWTATLKRSGMQTILIFSSTDSTVSIRPQGAAEQNWMSGIYAEDGNGNFVLQAKPPAGWDYPYDYVWSGTHQADSGTGFHVMYDKGKNIAGLEQVTFAKQS